MKVKKTSVRPTFRVHTRTPPAVNYHMRINTPQYHKQMVHMVANKESYYTILYLHVQRGRFVSF